MSEGICFLGTCNRDDVTSLASLVEPRHPNVSVHAFCRANGACHAGYRFAKAFRTMHEVYENLLDSEGTKWAMWAASCPKVLSDKQREELSAFLLKSFLNLLEDVYGGTPSSDDYRYLVEIVPYMGEDGTPVEVPVAEAISEHTDEMYHNGLSTAYEGKGDQSPLAAYCAGYHAWRGNPYETFDALMKLASEYSVAQTYSDMVRKHLIGIGNVFADGPVEEEHAEGK